MQYSEKKINEKIRKRSECIETFPMLVAYENAHRVLSVETMDSNELCIESVIESKNVSANKLSMAHSFGTHRYKTINMEPPKKPLRPLRTEEEEAIEEMPDYRT